MRTQQEILAKIESVAAEDFFGHQRSDLINYLDFENAKPFLKESATKEEWDSRENRTPAETIADYMSFAWGKANNCRGLSAGRSVEHMKAWLWLDGKDELSDSLDSIYEYYGKPCLVKVCEEYDLNWKQWDDNCWTNEEYGNGLTAEEALK